MDLEKCWICGKEVTITITYEKKRYECCDQHGVNMWRNLFVVAV